MSENPEIGVGPHDLPWPTDEHYDQQLLADGDRRNVEDKYRYWTVDAVKADLDSTRVDLHIAIENWQHDSNIGTIVRNANAFNVAAVHIIGRRHWNKRGAMVTDKYMHVHYHTSVDEFAAVMVANNRDIIAIDNMDGAVPLAVTTLPSRVVLVFGGEGPGLSQQLRHHAKLMVMIEQAGSTRSVNVGVAAGIVMYQWMLQHHLR